MGLTLKSSDSPPLQPFSFGATSPSADSDDSPTPPAAAGSPPAPFLTAKDMKLYGEVPLNQEIGIVRCADCDKPVLKSAIAEHDANCKKIRLGPAKKATKSEPATKKGKKRKADEAEEGDEAATGGPKKKAKKTATKVTKGRFKGPVDLDKQCGVINDKNLPCSRSLTCKSHSMGAKRSVLGRSKDYDQLLLEWNRANNPNWVEPVKRETKAEKKEKKEKEKAEKLRLLAEAGLLANGKKAKAAAGPKKGKKAKAAENDEEEEEHWDELDSEAECDELVQAVKRIRQNGHVSGVPLAVPADAGVWFVQRKERLRNCRDLLFNSLTGSGGLGTMTIR